MIFQAVAGVLGLVWVATWLWSRRKLYILSWKMPGPFGLPLVGSALSLVFKEKLMYIADLSRKYDACQSPIRIWLGTKLFIYVDNVEDVETVLSSSDCTNREDIYRYLIEALGVNGVFTLEGPIWKHHRRLVSPSFNYGVVIGYLPVFNRNCKQLIHSLGKKVCEPEFNIREIVVHSTLDLFLDATFGSDIISDSDKIKFKKYMAEGQEIVSKRMFSPWYHFEFTWNLTKYPAKLLKFSAFGKRLVGDLVADKIENGSANVTFLERMLRVSQENESFSLEDVRAEATNTLTAATDTSGWSVAFTLLMLAIHPDIQERVVDELRNIFPSKDCDVSRSDLEKLDLLDRCIYEALRLFPVVTMMARKCEVPFKLHGYEIPVGTAVAVGVREIHRKARYWGPNSNAYDPDHFLPHNVQSRSPYCFIPFSAGPRNCIGIKYAMVAMKVILCHILRNYRLTTSLKLSELQVRMDINIFLINGHMVQIHNRDF